MSTSLTLIAHGTTKALRAATFGGDDPLDDSGRANAERLAGILGRVDHCWTSPALRARQTAIALGVEAEVEERLRECDYGKWAGLQFKQVLLRNPFALASWIKNPATAPHGGETISQLVERVASWINERMKDRGHTIALTHSSIIRAAIVHVIGAPYSSFWRIDVLPLSRTELRTNGRRWVLRSICPLASTESVDGS